LLEWDDSPVDDIRQLYQRVRKALTANVRDRLLLLLAIRFHKRLYRNDRKGLYELLTLRYGISSEQRDIALLYDLAITAFALQKYDEAMQYFSKLEVASQGHPNRSGIRDIARGDGGKPMEFTGRVVNIVDRREGYLYCNELASKLKFTPIRQVFAPQHGDLVSFHIGFNYRALLALDMKR
jgi:hypothetical protein